MRVIPLNKSEINKENNLPESRFSTEENFLLCDPQDRATNEWEDIVSGNYSFSKFLKNLSSNLAEINEAKLSKYEVIFVIPDKNEENEKLKKEEDGLRSPRGNNKCPPRP